MVEPEKVSLFQDDEADLARIRPRRSVLYMPGAKPQVLQKGRTLPADVLIFDLEDSVAPSEKEEARRTVIGALRRGDYGRRELVVRINGLDTAWGAADLLAVAEVRPDAILLPKVASPGDIMFAAADLAKAGAPDDLRLWAMIETPQAIMNLAAIGRTALDPASRLDVLVAGTNDLAKETRIRPGPDRAPLLPWLSLCVAAARSHGLDMIDGVCNRLDDPAGFRAECEQGRDFGMDGKTCIHPNQIAVCNEVFAPRAEDVAWSRKIVDAFARQENAAAGVLKIEGRMVERLHAAEARRVLALAEALEDPGPGEPALAAVGGS